MSDTSAAVQVGQQSPSTGHAHAGTLAVAALRAPLLLAIAVTLLVLAPFALGYLEAPRGMVFPGTLKAIGDEGVYMAAVRAGAAGDWLWHDPYMAQTPPPILMYPTYMLVGHLDALLRLSVAAGYVLAHAAAALALFGALWALGRPYLAGHDRAWFVTFALCTSGLYWLDALLGIGGNAPASLAWMALPPLGGMTSALMGVHETLSTAALCALFAALLRLSSATGPATRWRAWSYGCLGVIVIGLTMPLLLPVALLVVALFACWSARNAARGDAGVRLRLVPYLATVGTMCLPGLALALYYYWQLRFGPWSVSDLRQTGGARPLVESLLQWAALLPLAWWGWRRAPAQARPLATLLGLWIVCAALGSQASMWQSFRYVTGLNVMIGALFALGLLPRAGARVRGRLLAVLSLGSLAHLLFLTPILASGLATNLYRTADLDATLRWLGTHTTRADLVLAPTGDSNAIPDFASCRLITGYDLLTFDAALRNRQLHAFYGPYVPATRRLATLRQIGADYVVYDLHDGEDGPFNPRALPGLRIVFATTTTAVLRVDAPRQPTGAAIDTPVRPGSPGASTLGWRVTRNTTVVLPERQPEEQERSMDTTRMGALALGAALMISTIIGQASPAHAAGGTLLRYKFKVGQKIGYLITVNGTTSLNAGVQQDTTTSERIPYTERVKTVYADGSALIEDSFGAATSTTNGQATTLPLAGAKLIMHITPAGKVLSSKSTGITDMQTRLSISSAAGTAAPLPQAPVSMGSTWKTAQSVSLGQLGQINGSGVYSLTALAGNVATIHGTATAPLKLSQAGIQASGKATAVTDTQFDAAKGILVGAKSTVQLKARLDLGSAAAGSQPGGITVKEQVTVSRTP